MGPIHTRNKWVQRPGHEVNHSHQSNVEIKNRWSYISAPPYMYSWRRKEKHPLFLVWCDGNTTGKMFSSNPGSVTDQAFPPNQVCNYILYHVCHMHRPLTDKQLKWNGCLDTVPSPLFFIALFWNFSGSCSKTISRNALSLFYTANYLTQWTASLRSWQFLSHSINSAQFVECLLHVHKVPQRVPILSQINRVLRSF